MTDVDDLFNCFDEEPEEEKQKTVPIVLVEEDQPIEVDDDPETSKNSLKRQHSSEETEIPKKPKIESLLDDIK